MTRLREDASPGKPSVDLDALAEGYFATVVETVEARLAKPPAAPIDPLAVAEKILSGRRGATCVSLDETIALATAVTRLRSSGASPGESRPTIQHEEKE